MILPNASAVSSLNLSVACLRNSRALSLFVMMMSCIKCADFETHIGHRYLALYIRKRYLNAAQVLKRQLKLFYKSEIAFNQVWNLNASYGQICPGLYL